MKNVYLSGPIGGLTYAESISWCDYVKNALAKVGITGWRPLRAKSFLAGKGAISAEANTYQHPLATSKGIMARDFMDTRRADLVICNFTNAGDRVSIGTCMEAAWAFALHIPVIAIGSADDIHIKHPMMSEAITYRVDTLNEAIELAKAILLP